MNRLYLAAAIVVFVIAPIASRRFEAAALESTIAGFVLGLRSQTIESLHWLGSRFDDWVAAVLAHHARQATISIANDRRICEMTTMRVLAGIVVGVTTGLILSIAGLPIDWLSYLVDMSIG